ncbi:MAG: hypothetical protein H6571_22835 [Lewinellaceae bacterium]|nr:hypothetical protein [Lewinellaceae bacterium]
MPIPITDLFILGNQKIMRYRVEGNGQGNLFGIAVFFAAIFSTLKVTISYNLYFSYFFPFCWPKKKAFFWSKK